MFCSWCKSSLCMVLVGLLSCDGDIPQGNSIGGEGAREDKPSNLILSSSVHFLRKGKLFFRGMAWEIAFNRQLMWQKEHSFSCPHLRSFIRRDDQGSKEIQDSIYKQCQEQVEEYSAVDVGDNIIFQGDHGVRIVDVITIQKAKKPLTGWIKVPELEEERKRRGSVASMLLYLNWK